MFTHCAHIKSTVRQYVTFWLAIRQGTDHYPTLLELWNPELSDTDKEIVCLLTWLNAVDRSVGEVIASYRGGSTLKKLKKLKVINVKFQNSSLDGLTFLT